MNKITKRIALGLAFVMATAFLAGCGSEEKMGYVDVVKVRQESAKGKEISAKVTAKQQAITERLEKVEQGDDQAKLKEEVAKAKQEMNLYGYAMEKEFENTMQATVAQIARDKKLTVVVDKYAITSGGTDITQDVLDQMNKSSKENPKGDGAAKGDASKDAKANGADKKEEPAKVDGKSDEKK